MYTFQLSKAVKEFDGQKTETITIKFNNLKQFTMVRIILIMMMSWVSFTSYAQNESSENEFLKVTVTINNMMTDKGTIYFSLYNSEGNFQKRIALSTKNSKIVDGKAIVIFEGLVKGNYAVICYHDRNDNKKMDFSENGMPLEDYGTTNNVMGYGPPNFEDAKFEVLNKDLTFEIKL